jgi:hypothetical protein
MFTVPRSSLSQTEQEDGRRESNKRTRVVDSPTALRVYVIHLSRPILLFDLGSEDGATAAVLE